MDAIKRFILKVLAVFGLCPIKMLRESEKEVARLSDNVRALKELNVSLSEQISESNTMVAAMRVKLDTYESLINEHKQKEIDYADTKTLIEDLQKALYEAVKEDKGWGMHQQLAFPGSISVKTATLWNPEDFEVKEDNDITIISGAAVLPDDYTDSIRNADSVRSKLAIINEFLHQYNVYDKLMEYIVRTPSIEYCLAYNTDCTAYKVWYRLVVNTPKSAHILTEL